MCQFILRILFFIEKKRDQGLFFNENFGIEHAKVIVLLSNKKQGSKMKKLNALLVAGALFSSVANAELISTDWKVAGDGYSTLDTVSGLEWLDLSLTKGMSYSTVESKTEAGGSFEGWRLPTEAEVIALINNSVLDKGLIDYGDYSSNSSATYSGDFASKFGNFVGSHAEEGVNTVAFSGVYSNLMYTYEGRGAYSKTATVAYLDLVAGVFLVSDGGMTLGSTTDSAISSYQGASDVNAPLAFGAIGLMLAGAGLRSRKKK